MKSSFFHHRQSVITTLATCVSISGLVLLSSCKDSATPSASATTTTQITTASGVKMVSIPGGEFAMGSDADGADEKPAHKVKISAFLMDQYEVTGAMFVKAEISNPSHWQTDPQMPIEQIRWRDARIYCNERSLLENLTPCYDEDQPGWPLIAGANGYRLPTEAEWEYAARAGGVGKFGDIDEAKLKQHAWFDSNSQKRTYPVGVKKPNAWGLYDMLGNVSEWCEDVYAADYYANSPSSDPAGPQADGSGKSKRVMRGGNWKSSASMCRVTFRTGQLTGDSDACFTTDYCGFRCVRRITAEELKALTQ